MLSSTTLSLLATLQEESHAAYCEGGLHYTYVEAANQAHIRLPAASGASDLKPSALLELGRFLEASQGHDRPTSVAPKYSVLAQQLMVQLKADLKFDEVTRALEDGGTDMTANVKMARRTDTRFFSL